MGEAEPPGDADGYYPLLVLREPASAGVLDPLAQLLLAEVHAQADQNRWPSRPLTLAPRSLRWIPGELFDHQLDGLVAYLRDRIVAVSDADQPLAELGHELFRALVAGLQRYARLHASSGETDRVCAFQENVLAKSHGQGSTGRGAHRVSQGRRGRPDSQAR